ncbi:AAA family ATPase, partial [Sphaerospermopsis aphanizomenoides BCCUSP55]|uniref:AAA family ATPase n=1 Tax=Sphaerospermopsis aphanizomenoides TaxID=459663 RepID=UPI001907A975
MKLIIKNLGPIKNNTQAIDLNKDFFVFVGRNNSGKSYVAQLLWAICNQDLINKFAMEYLDIIDEQIAGGINIKITAEILDNVLNKYIDFLQREVQKEIFNVSNQSEILNNIAIAFDYQISEFQAQEVKIIITYKEEQENTLEY